MRMPSLTLALFYICCAAPLWAEEPPKPAKHISMPFKTLGIGAWDATGQSYPMEIEDPALGKLTLVMRIARVTETSYTIAGDGTDFEQTYALLPEEQAGAIVAAKRRLLGEPLDAKKGEAFIRFCLAVEYFRYADAELGAQAATLPPEKRAELAKLALERRAESFVQRARTLSNAGDFASAGRMLAEANALFAQSAQTQSERLTALDKEARALSERIAAEQAAEKLWAGRVAAIKQALDGAQGDEAALIARLRGDLEAPLPAERRTAILKNLRALDRDQLNYTQALELLKEFSFEVRYGGELKRGEIANLDDFFAAEQQIDAYFDEANDAAAVKLADKLLALPGLTDKAFEALVRYGFRTPPPPERPGGEAADAPYALRAPNKELEIRCDMLVALPATYHPAQRRPLLLALHGMGGDAKQALATWLPEAQKHGWIVAAPECIIGRGKGYGSLPEERAFALRTIAECVQRFAIDPNRIYMAGHSMGGHMSWDVGLTYPDRFAAVAPFIGNANGTSQNYIQNISDVPFYCVDGERDGGITKVNRLVADFVKTLKFPPGQFTYIEYPNRGHEQMQEEIPKVLAWMDKLARPRAPKQIDFVSFDTETSRVAWLEMLENMSKKTPTTDVAVALRAGGFARLAGTVGVGNALDLTAANIRGVRVYVSSELFDLTKPLKVSLNHGAAKLIKIEPSRRHLLEFARKSGDRERLYWGSFEVPAR